MADRVNDQHWMDLAAEVAASGYPMPNPHVGCVLVKDGVEVGRGFHDHAGGPHAEVVALGQAGSKAQGATAYVTLEPCNHTGRTGPCSQALIEAKVARVVIGVADPNPVASGGVAVLRGAGIEVDFIDNPASAEACNRWWLTAIKQGRPYLVLKAAVGLDGRLALPDGTSKWITSEPARTAGHVLRARCGAVLVGARTFVLDRPELTARIPGVVNQPRRLVWDPQQSISEADLNGFSRLTASEPQALLEELFQIGVRGLLIEGGAVTLSKFVDSGLVNQVDLFVAPKVLGEGPTWFSGQAKIQELGLALRHVEQLGPDAHLCFF